MKPAVSYNRRTKIVCTIGPATSSAESIEQLIRTGMDVARLNLSHGTIDEHAAYVRTVREQSQRLHMKVAVLMDLPGPKYRTGKVKRGRAELKKGDILVLTTEQVEGNAHRVSVNLPNLPVDIRPGNTVLLADGAIQLKTLEIDGNEVKTRVVVGGMLTEGRGLVVPGMRVSAPFITDTLVKLIEFASKQEPEYLAISFVTCAGDVTGVRELLRQHGADVPIIAKIERGEAVDNFDSILKVSDGIMVARGDLGVEIPLERVPLVQKDIIRRCNRAGKPVITATEMLESMVNSARPTRAETTDVANAIFDGTDATMLSAETSIGKYPVEAVRFMAQIARETEKKLPYERILQEREGWLEHKTDELIAYDAVHTALMLKAAAIVAYTRSGSTAGRVSKHRPRMPVLAITPSDVVSGRLLLYWGVYPFHIPERPAIEELFATAARLAREQGLARPGDSIVITGGIPVGVVGSTNLLKVEIIEEGAAST